MIFFSYREKDAFDNNYDYDYDYYDNYDSLMSSPDPIKDFTKNTNLLFQKNPVPNFPQQLSGGWPTKLNDAFKNSNVKNINYLGLHTNPSPQSQVSFLSISKARLLTYALQTTGCLRLKRANVNGSER